MLCFLSKALVPLHLYLTHTPLSGISARHLCKRKMCLGHGDVREYGAKTQKQENGKTRKRLWTPWKRDATGAARKREYGQTTRKRENGENAKTAKTAKISLPVKVSYMFTLPLLGREQIRFNLMRVSISFYFNGNIENLLLPHDGIARADWNIWKSRHSHHMGFCHKSIPGRWKGSPSHAAPVLEAPRFWSKRDLWLCPFPFFGHCRLSSQGSDSGVSR